jgi:hypothetical protein
LPRFVEDCPDLFIAEKERSKRGGWQPLKAIPQLSSGIMRHDPQSMEVVEEAMNEADLLSPPKVAARPGIHPFFEHNRRRSLGRIDGVCPKELIQVLQGGLWSLDAFAECSLQSNVRPHVYGQRTDGLWRRIEVGEG